MKETIACIPILYAMLKEFFQAEGVYYPSESSWAVVMKKVPQCQSAKSGFNTLSMRNLFSHSSGW